MASADPAPILDADFEEICEQRRTDRRAGDRRAARLQLHPLFAATLVNHIAHAEAMRARIYAEPAPVPRAGIIVNLRA